MAQGWSEPCETARLRLRPLSMDDADALHPLQSDPEMMRYFGGPYVRRQTETWLEWHVAMWEQEGYSVWAAQLKDGGTFVGWIGLTKVFEPEELSGATEVGWFVDRAHWRQGLATEGGGRALQFGFDILNLERILARYDPENVASGKVMEKLGMRVVGDMPKVNAPGTMRVYEISSGELALPGS
jgi:ribosomal-protein-alanine N-acetyltransferase